jgi:tRNA threonylcarbamoyladenosine biosynthesis protein TsaB
VAFDCSGKGCGVAVTANGGVLARRAVEQPQSEALIPLIAAALRDSGLGWTEIDLIGLTVGPGRFTSLRVGLAAARGLALAADIPIAGVATADALAAGPSDQECAGRAILAVIDGGRADLFVQAFDRARLPLGPIQALMPEDAAGLIAGPALLVGDGAHRVIDLMPEARASDTTARPDPAIVSRLACRAFADGRALPPSPLYLLPPDITPPKRASAAP